MQLDPYLYFNGRCDEAVQFYVRALGAKVTSMSRFKDSPDPRMCPPGMEQKVMHASLQIGQSSIMVSDGECKGNGGFAGFSLAIAAESEAEAERVFAGLSEGGKVQMPLAKTFFSPRFGMVADRFGVSWMVLVMTRNPSNAASA